jgi:RimJ/RimL family protein N-acetyltransferase
MLIGVSGYQPPPAGAWLSPYSLHARGAADRHPATEDEARARGVHRIELHVFGGNDVARGLYRSLGYVETSVLMGKDLG